MKLVTKDLGLAVDLARDVGVPAEMAALVEQIHLRAQAAYGDAAGEMSAIRLYEDLSHLHLRAQPSGQYYRPLRYGSIFPPSARDDQPGPGDHHQLGAVRARVWRTGAPRASWPSAARAPAPARSRRWSEAAADERQHSRSRGVSRAWAPPGKPAAPLRGLWCTPRAAGHERLISRRVSRGASSASPAPLKLLRSGRRGNRRSMRLGRSEWPVLRRSPMRMV